MRTTLNIDDDVLKAIREMAKRQSKTTGAVVSGLLRQSLTGSDRAEADNCTDEPAAEFGFRPFRKRGGRLVTNDSINRLRKETGD